MPRMAGAGIPWDSVWTYSVPGFQDLEIEITVDTEATMEPEDPTITAEEPGTTQINLREEVISRAGSNRTRSSFTITMDSIISQLGSRTRVVVVIMFLQQSTSKRAKKLKVRAVNVVEPAIP